MPNPADIPKDEAFYRLILGRFFIAGLNAGAFIMRKEVLKDVKNAFYVGVCY